MASVADQLWEDAGQPLCEEFYGVLVVLERSGENSEEFTAIADLVHYTVENAEGFFTTVATRDYTLPVESTVINGVTIEPRPGDRIHEMINGTEQIFEVLPIGNSPAVSLAATGKQWLVHTDRAR